MKRFKDNGAILQAVCALVSILIGLVLLFSKSVDLKSLCYVFCILLWGVGLYEIVAYFVRKAYQKLEDYGFTLGVLLLILGLLGLIQIDAMAKNVKGYLLLISLIQSVFILQNSVQLYALKSRASLLDFIFSLLMIILSVFALSGPLKQYTYGILLFAGVFGLVSILLSTRVVRSFQRKDEGKTDEEKH